MGRVINRSRPRIIPDLRISQETGGDKPVCYLCNVFDGVVAHCATTRPNTASNNK